jgi:uncharacterized protein (DUF2235 family)
VPSADNSRRRLVLCFDGTWNKPEDQTNVWRLYSAIPDAIPDVPAGIARQLKYYDTGVGTERMNKLFGGAFGWGLDRNVLEGYCWLIKNFLPAPGGTMKNLAGRSFTDGDEIWLFGFSRGAYTARSLAGLIGRCGILKRSLFDALPERKDKLLSDLITPDHDLVTNAWEMYRRPGGEVYVPGSDGEPTDELGRYRDAHSHMVTIRFIGVWDTVGALGVPETFPLSLANWRYKFHDTNLGFAVENAFQALAIDENRKDYKATLWTRWRSFQNVEQRWFPGAHANVGGGYEDDLLFAPPLAWMAERALGCGLQFSAHPGGPPGSELPVSFRMRGDEYLAPVRDSFKEFLVGAYRVVVKRWHRPMLVEGINELVDQTADRKWAADPSYRPLNLAMAGRPDINAERATPHDLSTAKL